MWNELVKVKKEELVHEFFSNSKPLFDVAYDLNCVLCISL